MIHLAELAGVVPYLGLVGMEDMRPVGVNGYALRVATVEVAAGMPALIDYEHALASFGQLVRRDRAIQSCANY